MNPRMLLNNLKKITVITVFALGLSLLALPSSASAQSQALSLKSLSGGELVELCKSQNAQDNTRCIGYIEGLIDYHVLIRSLGTAPTVDFCIPQDAKMEDVVVQVIDYLHQYEMNDPFIAAPAISLALFDAFPC
ncbi:MAG: hypothetical protein CMP22_06410 [Rickettsiales bacterium]|nr:hypothetical protein [Rickettsiales bacterium]